MLITNTKLITNGICKTIYLKYEQADANTYTSITFQQKLKKSVKIITYSRSITQEELNKEEWKIIPDGLDKNYNSKFIGENSKYKVLYNSSNYCASNIGRFGIYDKLTNTINLLKIIKSSNTNNYMRISMYNTNFSAHKIIALMFVICPNYNLEYYSEIDHIDNNPLNNSAYNLMWVTSIQNALKRNKERDPNAHKTSGNRGKRINEVMCKNLNTNKIYEFASPTEASEKLGIDYNKLTECCRIHKKLQHNDILYECSYKKEDSKIYKIRVWEPIVQLKDGEDLNRYTIENIFIFQKDFDAYFKDTCINLKNLRINILKRCKRNEDENTSVYGSNGSRWVYLRQFNNLVSSNKQIDINSLVSCDIVKTTLTDKFIKHYSNLYDFIDENVNIDSVIQMCDNIHTNCYLHNYSIRFNNLQRKVMYTQDFLKMKSIDTIESLSEKDTYIE